MQCSGLCGAQWVLTLPAPRKRLVCSASASLKCSRRAPQWLRSAAAREGSRLLHKAARIVCCKVCW